MSQRPVVTMDVTVTGAEVLKEWLQNFSLRADFQQQQQRTAVERAMLNPGEPLIVTPEQATAAGFKSIVEFRPHEDDEPNPGGWQEVSGTISVSPFTAGQPWSENEVKMQMLFGTYQHNDSVSEQNTGGAAGSNVYQPWKVTPQPSMWTYPPLVPMEVGVDLDNVFSEWDEPDFPHEDTRVLHGPGMCSECDKFKPLQTARMRWGIAFTDDPVRGGDMPCPSSKGWRWLAKVFARRIVAKAIRMVVEQREGRAITLSPDA